MLTCEHLRLTLQGREILRDVSARFEKGKYTALIGPNGSGKTTLLAVLSGLIKPDDGRAAYGGRDVCRMDARTRARVFAVVQQRETQSMPFTGLETVLLGLTPHRPRFGAATDAELAMARKWMALTDTLSFSDRPVGKLSGGEFQRLVLARALTQRPEVLFLDEAMSEMDVRAQRQMQKLLRDQIRESGLTVVSVHHDLSQALTASEHVVALKDGRVAAEGPTERTLTEGLIQSVFGVWSEVRPGAGVLIRDAIEIHEERGTHP